ncbi:MAG: hypothetical protein RBS56_04445 [Candidatus Gracilibacteria bacterium]|jgi:hypothetical protein|nr:hypothetical protein [Candidatus Gracilibacteria bacterium]
MSDFSRKDVVTRVDYSEVTSTEVEDLTHLAQEELEERLSAVPSLQRSLNEEIKAKTKEEHKDKEDIMEAIRGRRELLKIVLNGNIFDFYDYEGEKDLEEQIALALEEYRREERSAFIERYNVRVPMGDFDANFTQKRERIVQLYKFQKAVAESTNVFNFYNTREWERIISKDYFKTDFLRNFVFAISFNAFNTEGFKELMDTHEYLEDIFSKGSFDEFGASLLKEALEEYRSMLLGVNRKFPDISDEFITVLISIVKLLESLEKKNFRFEKSDIIRLRNAYRYNKHNFSEFTEIGLKLKEAIIKYRNPTIISSGLLSTNDVSQITIALNILRSTVGRSGLIRVVDLDKLREISTYLDDVYKFKAGLLTIQENEILKQLVCNLKILVQKSNVFGLSLSNKQRDLILDEVKLLGKGLYEQTKSMLDIYKKPIMENTLSPTMIFDPLVLSLKFGEETRKTVEVDDQVHKEDIFLRKIKYVRESPAFDYLYAQKIMFENKLRECEEALEKQDMQKLMEEISSMELPNPIKMEDYFDNDLERYLILEMAHIYEELKKQGVSFTQNISEHLFEFENEKEELKPKLLRMSLLSYAIANIFASQDKTHNQTHKINSIYGDIKRYVLSQNEKTDPRKVEFTEFLSTMESLYILSSVFDIGSQIFNFEIYSYDPGHRANEIFTMDAKRFIESLIYFASTRNFKKDFVLDPETHRRLEKVVKFALDLKLIFPSFDDSVTSRKMAELALKKFKSI